MKIVLYLDKKRILKNNPQRKSFSIIDGIIGGENNGPLTPDEKKGGVVISGSNLLAVDTEGTRLMGFDWRKLKWIENLLCNKHFSSYVTDAKNIKIMTNISEFQDMFNKIDKYFSFKQHSGWPGYIEI